MVSMPYQVTLLRNAELPEGGRFDVEIEGGRVRAVHPAGSVTSDEGLDLDGYLLLPAPAEPHAHLDKARSWDTIRPPMGNLERAVTSWRDHTLSVEAAEIEERALSQAMAMLRRGTTAVRTHVDLLSHGDPLRGVDVLNSVRARLRGLMDVELVALPHTDIAAPVIEEALRRGVEVVGGAPHLAPDPPADLHRLLDIAEKHGVGVDLHTDERLDGEPTLGLFARRVRDWSRENRTLTASHVVRLGTLPEQERDTLISEVVHAGLGIVSLPITNLYLQGWEDPVATPRGLTALRPLLEAGSLLGAGADNVRDPFNPVGRSDAFETASLLVAAGHLTVFEAYELVSTGSRAVMGLEPAGPSPGLVADLLAVRAGHLVEAVAEAPEDRYVIRKGNVVSRTETTTHSARPTSASSERVTELR